MNNKGSTDKTSAYTSIINNKELAEKAGFGKFYAIVEALFISRECKKPPTLEIHLGLCAYVCLKWEDDLLFARHLEQLPKPDLIRVDGILRTGKRQNEQYLEIMFEPSEINDTKIGN